MPPKVKKNLIGKSVYWGKAGNEPITFYAPKKDTGLIFYAKILGEFLGKCDGVLICQGPGSILKTYTALNKILKKRALPMWELFLKNPRLAPQFVSEGEMSVIAAGPWMLRRFAPFLRKSGVLKKIKKIILFQEHGKTFLESKKRNKLSRLYPRADFLRIYGVRELDKTGYQCAYLRRWAKLSNKFHFFGNIHAEVSPKNELLVTTLGKMPTLLIRYRTGDFAKFDGKCRCGKEVFEILNMKHET